MRATEQTEEFTDRHGRPSLRYLNSDTGEIMECPVGCADNLGRYDDTRREWAGEDEDEDVDPQWAESQDRHPSNLSGAELRRAARDYEIDVDQLVDEIIRLRNKFGSRAGR